MTLVTLTKKHRLFIEAYDGDDVGAMRIAGWNGTDSYLRSKANELLADPLIIEAIKERSRFKAKTLKAIADREERQAFWTAVMRNEDPHHKEEVDANGVPIPQGNIPLQVRIAASEKLGKSEGDFIENVNVQGNFTFTELVGKSYEVEDDIESIEAEYRAVKEKQKQVEAPKSELVAEVIPLSRYI
jgi:hypothetical protein